MLNNHNPSDKRKTSNKCRIIAVGGAKGGVGKSVMAANLSVYLAAKGYRTVMVDLDLGAANLHLYMGVWALKHRINDYLDQKVESLNEIAVKTDYGPQLIGGGSNRLGSANLPFARKLKLMRAIRRLDADYIILDLGASTSFNILDFFLLADTQMVMTTCDPAAYLDAYTFIKMALHRRLSRIFGAESAYRKFKDEELLSIIHGFVSPESGSTPQKVSDLMEEIDRQAPQRGYLVQSLVDQFRPRLVVNLADSQEEVKNLSKRMNLVAHKMLSINVELAGTIFHNRDIARSTHDLKPEVGRHPDGKLSESIEQIFMATMGNPNSN